MSTTRKPSRGAALFTLVGIVLLSVSFATGMRKRRFLARAAVAEGVVVGVPEGGFHPKIEFTTASGLRVEFVGSGFKFCRLGDRLRVLYDPDRPRYSPWVDAFGAVWFPQILIAVIGLGHLVVGLGAMRRRSSQSRL